jgi:type I restriction enzyme S subunit
MTEMNGAFKETEIGPIPVDWDVVTVGSVGQVVTGTTPPTKEPEYYGGPYMFISPGDIGGAKYVTRTQKHLSEAGLKVSRQLPRHTVLVVCIGATIGKTAMTVAEQSATNQQINAVIANEEVFADYLYYALTHRSPRLPDLAGRAAVPIVNKSNFAKFLIPIAPLPEQRRIAQVLSTIQRAIAAQGDLIAAAREVKRSLMQRLFTYGPGPEPAPTKETEIGEIPEHWEVVRLGDHIAEGPQNGLYKPLSLYGEGTPIIRINDYGTDGRFTSLAFRRVRIDPAEVERYLLKENDILVNRVNSLPQLGKSILVPALLEPTVFESNMMRFAVDGIRLLPHYAILFLCSPQAHTQMVGKAKRAVAQSSINQGDVKSLLVPLPPASEQTTIVRMAAASNSKIEAEEQRKTALQALFKTMLHQLMTGQVRVLDVTIEGY